MSEAPRYSTERSELREIVARVLVPYYYGGFENQEREEPDAENFRKWKNPPGTPNARAYELTDKILEVMGTFRSAQGQSDRGEPDLKFANEQNIKAARKYKARLDFMEAKYGAIDWEADVTAQPTQGGDKGEAVACVCQGQHRRGYCTEPGCPYAAPQPASNAYPPWQPIETAPKDETRILLYQKGRGSFEGWWKLDWPLGEYWMDDADSEPEPTHWQPLLPAPSVPSTPRATPPDWKQDQAETSRLAPKLPSTDLGSGK